MGLVAVTSRPASRLAVKRSCYTRASVNSSTANQSYMRRICGLMTRSLRFCSASCLLVCLCMCVIAANGCDCHHHFLYLHTLVIGCLPQKYFRLNILECRSCDSRTPENKGSLYTEYVKSTNKLTRHEHCIFLSYIHLFLYLFYSFLTHCDTLLLSLRASSETKNRIILRRYSVRTAQ